MPTRMVHSTGVSSRKSSSVSAIVVLDRVPVPKEPAAGRGAVKIVHNDPDVTRRLRKSSPARRKSSPARRKSSLARRKLTPDSPGDKFNGDRDRGNRGRPTG